MNISILITALYTLVLCCTCHAGELRRASHRDVQTTTPTLSVVRLELIDGRTGVRIQDLYHKAIIDVAKVQGMMEPQFNIRAVLSTGAAVVIYDYNSSKNVRYDYQAPYMFCATTICSTLGYGVHKIKATAYTTTSLTTAGKPREIIFEIRKSGIIANPVSALQLMSTSTDPNKVVMELGFGKVNIVDLEKLGLSKAQFNIQAIGDTTVKSVVFSNGQIEWSRPLAYCGNYGPLFYTCNDLFAGATVNVTVTGYSSSDQTGTRYPTQWAIVQILPPSEAPPGPTPVAPVTVPVAAPITPPVVQRTCTIPEFKPNSFWSTPFAPYPISVAESQGTMIGKDFVIFSGFKNGYTMATTETYALDMSIQGAQWRRMDDMPFPDGLTHLGLAVKDMKAYICGGYVGGSLGTHNGSCFIYDHSKPTGQQWTTFAPIPKGGRSGGGMIYDTKTNSLVYAAGSQRPIAFQTSGIDFLDTFMYSLDTPEKGWVSKTNIPFNGNHMNFVTAYDQNNNERHYFFGGQMADNEEHGNTATMYEYVPSTDDWIQRTSMPFPRGHSAAASRAVNCGFIVAGGRTNTGLTDEVTYYDIPTDTWKAIGTLPVLIHTNVCVIYDDWLRCETGWAEGKFTAQRPLLL